MSWLELDRHFRRLRETPSNLNEHLDVLFSYAMHCDTVCELGTGFGVSTTALILAAPEVYTYDLCLREEIDDLMVLANFEGKHLVATLCDVTLRPCRPCDLLFIDSWHAYPQLKKELDLNHAHVRRWIILHDTETFKTQGEGWQDWELQHPGETLLGLQPALDEFLASHPEWQVKEHRTNNNGLTILERVKGA